MRVETLMIATTVLLFTVPAQAQMRLNSSRTPSDQPMVRIPPSSQLGAGMSETTSPPTKSMYPPPIRQDYNPNFADPTARNPTLRQR